MAVAALALVSHLVAIPAPPSNGSAALVRRTTRQEGRGHEQWQRQMKGQSQGRGRRQQRGHRRQLMYRPGKDKVVGERVWFVQPLHTVGGLSGGSPSPPSAAASRNPAGVSAEEAHRWCDHVVDDPVVIVGSDGSGTRVVAKFLAMLNVTMMVERSVYSQMDVDGTSAGVHFTNTIQRVLGHTHSPRYELRDLPPALSEQVTQNMCFAPLFSVRTRVTHILRHVSSATTPHSSHTYVISISTRLTNVQIRPSKCWIRSRRRCAATHVRRSIFPRLPTLRRTRARTRARTRLGAPRRTRTSAKPTGREIGRSSGCGALRSLIYSILGPSSLLSSLAPKSCMWCATDEIWPSPRIKPRCTSTQTTSTHPDPTESALRR